MKTLHLYLTRQVLATLVITVVVFTFVLLLGNALREIMEVIIKRQATLGGVAEAFGLLIPFVLAFALPLGMLTAALLVFGRFSADQELTAVRSSGISLVALVSPILILSLALCCVSAWINMEVGPRCRVAYKHLLFEMGVKLGGLVVPEGRYVKDFPGIIYYVGKNDAGNLRDIIIEILDENQHIKEELTADHGRIEVTNDVVTVRLFDAHTFTLVDGVISPGEQSEWMYTNTLKLSGATESQSLSDMTMGQLLRQRHELEQSFSVADTRKLNKDH
jgi:lipopolysaccharide export system permease protein